MNLFLPCLLTVQLFISLLVTGIGAENGDAVEKRIINGKEALPASHPYMVSLQIRNGTTNDSYGEVSEDAAEDDWRHFCGAVLIDRQWVLTAAHCVDFARDKLSRMRVKLGEHHQDEESDREYTRKVSRVVEHPRWCKCNLANDIGLVKLLEPARLDCNVQTVKMVDDNSTQPIYDNCVLVGWGRVQSGLSKESFNSAADVLQEVEMTNIPNDLCASIMSRFLENSTYEDVLTVRSTNICAMDTSPDPVHGHGSACHGDSGGPMMCGEDRSLLVGITSWGQLACEDKPNIYTRVSKYISWITETIDNDILDTL